MEIKRGTQHWSKSASQPDFKTDRPQNLSAADNEKYFDNENLGDTLNKISDPNWVDTSRQVKGVGNNEMGKDAFMTLLLTQMKNQDPTNPLKSHEMAAQLAQFTSLEKLSNINEGIDGLRKDQQPEHNFQALALIGKTITMDNSKILRNSEGEAHDLRFSLPSDAGKAQIEVKNADGDVVRKLEMKNLKTGANSMSWNGKTDEGTTAPKGDYTMVVTAMGLNGKKLYVQTKADGVITGVNFTAQGPQLMMGKQTISMADVKTISDPNVEQPQAQPLAPGPNNQPLPPMQEPQAQPQSKMMEVKPETKPDAKKRAAARQSSVNDNAMTSGLLNKLNKEGVKAGMGG